MASEWARKTLVRVSYTGLRCARTVRISFNVPRDHDAAVGPVAAASVVAAAADTVLVAAVDTVDVVVAAADTVVAAADTDFAAALAAGSTVVVADDATNMAVVTAGSVVVATTTYCRVCHHACHVLHHDHRCRYDGLLIPSPASLILPLTSGKGTSVRIITIFEVDLSLSIALFSALHRNGFFHYPFVHTLLPCLTLYGISLLSS